MRDHLLDELLGHTPMKVFAEAAAKRPRRAAGRAGRRGPCASLTPVPSSERRTVQAPAAGWPTTSGPWSPRARRCWRPRCACRGSVWFTVLGLLVAATWTCSGRSSPDGISVPGRSRHGDVRRTGRGPVSQRSWCSSSRTWLPHLPAVVGAALEGAPATADAGSITVVLLVALLMALARPSGRASCRAGTAPSCRRRHRRRRGHRGHRQRRPRHRGGRYDPHQPRAPVDGWVLVTS